MSSQPTYHLLHGCDQLCRDYKSYKKDGIMIWSAEIMTDGNSVAIQAIELHDGNITNALRYVGSIRANLFRLKRENDEKFLFWYDRYIRGISGAHRVLRYRRKIWIDNYAKNEV